MPSFRVAIIALLSLLLLGVGFDAALTYREAKRSKATMGALSSSLKSQESMLGRLSEDIGTLNTVFKSQESKLDRLSEDIGALNTVLKSQLNALEKEIAKTRAAGERDARGFYGELRGVEMALSHLQDGIAATIFSRGTVQYSPADIRIGARDTYDNLDRNWHTLADVAGKSVMDCVYDDGHKTVVLITLGQSNAANTGDGRYTATRDVLNFNLYDGKCYRASDPLLGTDGNGGNFSTRLADMLIARGLADRIIIAPIAMGGTKVEQWATEGLFNRRILALIRRLYDANLSPDYILWHQGEGNATDGDPGGRLYRKNLLEVVSTFRAYGVNAPFFIALATLCVEPVPSAENIRMGQRGAVNPQIGTFAGPDTDRIGLEHRHDQCHMSASGLDLHAKEWADILETHPKRNGALSGSVR